MKLIDAWGQKGIHAARWENAVDYVFILAYVTCLVAAVTRARERAAANRLTGLLRLGGVVIALPVLAGVLDAVQNLALLLLLGGHATGATPTVSLVCGVATALLGVAALGYVAAVAIAGGRDRGG
jgi:hypothetical protein